MTTAILLPPPRSVFYDPNGNPLSGGFVHTYAAGGTVPKLTWQDAGEGTPNSNPITLDADGSCLLYGFGNYQITVTDALGNAIPAYSGVTTDAESAIGISAAMQPVISASTLALARTAMGLGSMAVQDAIAVAITGGTIDGSGNAGGINVLTNTRLSKTAAYLVANADKGTTIALGGAATYALTFAAVGSYDANFWVMVQNEDPSNAKSMAIAGYTSFFLWPGQTIVINRNNAVWRYFKQDRWTPGAALGPTIYVSTTGNDANDGITSANALRNITTAFALAIGQIDWTGNNSVNIQLVAGTFTEHVFLSQNLVGANEVNFIGDPVTPSNVVWQVPGTGPQYGFQARDCGICSVTGVQFQGTISGQVGLNVSQYAIMDVTSCWFGGFAAGWAILLNGGGGMNWVPGTCEILGNFSYFAQVLDAGSNLNIIPSGATVVMPNALTYTAFMSIVGNSDISFVTALAFSGTGSGAGSTGVKYQNSRGGQLTLGGTTLPGASAGTTDATSFAFTTA